MGNIGGQKWLRRLRAGRSLPSFGAFALIGALFLGPVVPVLSAQVEAEAVPRDPTMETVEGDGRSGAAAGQAGAAPGTPEEGGEAHEDEGAHEEDGEEVSLGGQVISFVVAFAFLAGMVAVLVVLRRA